MKIQLMSDLHLEFEPTFRPKYAGADVLILSGDICMASYFEKTKDSPYYEAATNFRNFFYHCSVEFDNVIYIMGNHEHYRGYIDTTADVLRGELDQYSNIHFLDGDYIDIGDTRFIGTTMWTDLNRGNPVTEGYLRGGLNDFRLVQWKKNYTKFTPMDSYKLHQKALYDIAEHARGHEKVVVSTHHAPSFKSVHPRYHNDTHMNGGYYSELTDFIMSHQQIKLWTHGHMHDCFEYDIMDTKVWCNPRGYNDENKYFKPTKVMEI